MTHKNALLIIDAQYDFCHPEGALYVPNAEQDMRRLAQFINTHVEVIDHICVTLDTHFVNDISHPAFWQDEETKTPPPFTQITAAEVKAGKWTPRFFPEKTKQYLENLEAQGQFPHFIWPEHCLAGSKGNALDEQVMQAVLHWAHQQGKDYQVVVKGTYPLTEHFGIFAAQVPEKDHPETLLNKSLIEALYQYDQVYVAGEAKSHCVATSIQQAMDYAPDLAAKMTIIEDCMSDVAGLGHLGTPIYDRAKKENIPFITSDITKLP